MFFDEKPPSHGAGKIIANLSREDYDKITKTSRREYEIITTQFKTQCNWNIKTRTLRNIF